MKELSIEEKAKAYTELINRLEDVKDAIKKQNYGIAMDVLCKPYPQFQVITHSELKESEDERTRKNIIKAFKIFEDKQAWVGHCLDDIDWDACIAWVEKQGEHANFCNKIQIGDKVTRNQDGVLVNLSQLKRVAKPAEKYNITGIGSKHAQGKLGEMIKNLKSAWSEEDCNQIETIACHLDNIGNGAMAESLLNIMDKYKSIRPRNTWKPSDEQMTALRRIKAAIAGEGDIYKPLNSLYEDLKKLMEV